MKPPKRTCREFDSHLWRATISAEARFLRSRGTELPTLDWAWSRMLVISQLRGMRYGFAAIAQRMP